MIKAPLLWASVSARPKTNKKMEEKLYKIITQQQAMLEAFTAHIDTLYYIIYALLIVLLIYAAANVFFSYYIDIIDFIQMLWTKIKK